MNEEIKIIGKINFHDRAINVYYHPDCGGKTLQCTWQIRNPDSDYCGILYMNMEIGRCTYPYDAIIPEQTDSDREMLPKFFIVGKHEFNDELIKSIMDYIEPEYLRRNKKMNTKNINNVGKDF